MMQVWNISESQVQAIADMIGVKVDASRVNGKSIRVKAYPNRETRKFARRSASGRRVHAICTHGFEQLISELFASGATRVKSTMGDWTSIQSFIVDVPSVNGRNVGSPMYPHNWTDLCDH